MLAAELDARIAALAARRSTISARVEALDAALEELGALEAEISQRLGAQRSERDRLKLAAGDVLVFGHRAAERSVVVVDGRGTHVLSGPRPPATVGGLADRAERVLAALEGEAQVVHDAGVRLADERKALRQQIHELGVAIGQSQSQRGQLMDATAERAQVIGERLDWAERASDILRRLGLGP